MTKAQEMLELANSIEEGHARVVHLNENTQWAPYKTKLVIEALRLAAQPQSSPQAGKAFHQIAHDEGKPDLAALWQAVIDNTKGGGFWLGELLLTTIEQETGFNGSANMRSTKKEPS